MPADACALGLSWPVARMVWITKPTTRMTTRRRVDVVILLCCVALLCFDSTTARKHERGKKHGGKESETAMAASAALRLQAALSTDTPVSDIVLCGAHRPFNTRSFYPEALLKLLPSLNSSSGLCRFGRCVRGFIDIHSQTLDVTRLLELGVRRLSIDVHYIPDLGLKVCRGDPYFHAGCLELQRQVREAVGFNLDVCGSLLGVEDLGNTSTGCTKSSAGYEVAMEAISKWARNPANKFDFLVVDLIDHVTDAVKTGGGSSAHDMARKNASSTLQRVLVEKFSKRNLLFTPGHLKRFQSRPGMSGRWPTPRQLRKLFGSGKVIFLADTSSKFVGERVHARPSVESSAAAHLNAAKKFNSTKCSRRPFATVHESLKQMKLEEVSSTGAFKARVSNENGRVDVGAITPQLSRSAMQCGRSPTLELVTPSKILSTCVWTWASGNRAPGRSSKACILFDVNQGTWMSKATCKPSALRKACRSNSDSMSWRLSKEGKECPSAFKFSLPSTPQESAALRLAARNSKVTGVLLPPVESVTEAASSKSSHGGLSKGATAGIVVGVIVAVLVVLAAVYALYIYRNPLSPSAQFVHRHLNTSKA